MAEKTEKDLPILVDDAEIADDSSLDQVIELLGGKTSNDILLKVYREIGNKEIEWCFDASPDALPLEPFLLSEYGGGVFVVHIYSPTKRGNKGKRKEVTIRVAKRLTPTAPPVNQLETLVEGIMRANAEMLRGFAEQQRLTLENTLLKSGAGAAQGLTVEGLLQLLPLIKQLSGGGESRSSIAQLKDAIELMNEVRELAPGDGGGKSELLGYVNVLKDLAMQARVAAPTSPAASSQPQAGVYLEDNQPTEGDMFNLIVRQKLAELCKLAAAGRSPELYADVVLDQVPEGYYEQLLLLIGSDNAEAMRNLCSVHPAVGLHGEWFGVLCDSIRAQFDNAPGLTESPGNDISAAVTQGKATDVSNAAPGAGEPANTTGSDTGRP